MLVLSRKADEQIHIGDDVTIEVRKIQGNRVTLGIVAPGSIRIVRGELTPFDEVEPISTTPEAD